MQYEKTFRNMKYIEAFPDDYAPGKACPVLIFMAGAGTRGTDLNQVRENPFFKLTGTHADFPFLVFAPQCHTDTWFDLFETVNAFARHISELSYVDPSRIYLMGASMGGYAVWQMAMSSPSLYAAIVPICGGGMYWNAYRLAQVPVWAFHGDLDPVVKVEESQKMVDAVNANGGNARLTVYRNCFHDAWSETYASKEVFAWLLRHRKGDACLEKSGFQDSNIYG